MEETKFKPGDEVNVIGKKLGKSGNRLRIMLIDSGGVWLSQQKPSGKYEGWHGPYQLSSLERVKPEKPQPIQQKLL